jgi:hypothetical protein
MATFGKYGFMLQLFQYAHLVSNDIELFFHDRLEGINRPDFLLGAEIDMHLHPKRFMELRFATELASGLDG